MGQEEGGGRTMGKRGVIWRGRITIKPGQEGEGDRELLGKRERVRQARAKCGYSC